MKLLFFISILIGCLTSAEAALLLAASVEEADVSAQEALATNGDVIFIPEGSANWTNGITTTKKIRFVGANTLTETNRTVITHTGATSQSLFRFSTSANNSNTIFGVSYLTIRGNNKSVASGLIHTGTGVTSTNLWFRMHHLHMHEVRHRGIDTVGLAEGLIDQNWIHMPYNGAAQSIKVEGFGRSASAVTNASPSGTPALGITNFFVYVERNILPADFPNDAAIEGYRDVHIVVRSNIIEDAVMGIHDNSQNSFAAVWEYYGNQINIDHPDALRWLVLRGGWGVVWNNTVSTLSISQMLVQCYRASGTDVFAACSPIDACPGGCYYTCNGVTGTNRFDYNGNNATTIGYPAWEQVGWGDPKVWTSTNQTSTFYGAYSWNNVVNGTTNTATAGFRPHSFCNQAFGFNCNAGLTAYDGVRDVPQTEDLVVEGRDMFSNTERPSYTPLDRHPMSLDISLTPAATNVAPTTVINFASSDSFGTVYYRLYENNSGASINSSTGEYTAGAGDGVIDIVQVIDSIGGVDYCEVLVTSGELPPTITPIADQVILKNSTTGPLAFTIGDPDEACSLLTLSRASSDESLLPLAGITFGGSDCDRTVTVVPATNTTGEAFVTVTVTDTSSLFTNTTFKVTVQEPPPAPVESFPGNLSLALLFPQL